MVVAVGGPAAATSGPALSPDSITSVAVDDRPSSGSPWKTRRWSPYAVGVGICVPSWLAFLLSDKPLGVSTAYARTSGMRGGDGILLFGTRERAREFEPTPDLLWLREPRSIEAPERLRRLALPATLIFLAVIATAAFKILPISVAALAGAAGMILLGILSPKEAYERIE